MNDKQRETLSAFFDGEVTDPETVEALVRQGGSMSAFAALCQQRDALHGQLSPHLPADFAERVAGALADEPAILSPAPGRAETASTPPPAGQTGQVVQGWFGGRWANTAIAASVAALGFAALVMFDGGRQPGDALAPVAAVNAPVPTTAVVQAPELSVRQDAVLPVTSDVRRIDINRLSPQLREQLIQHIEARHRAQQAGAQPSDISYQPGN